MLDTSFNSVEVFKMAKKIEKRGLEFYQNQAGKTDDQNLKNLLLKLAQDEEDHYDRFNQLLSKTKAETKERAKYVYDPDVSAYFEALVEFSVFPREEEVQLDSLDKILKLAIMAEKDSILFYYEMLEHNQGETVNVLKQLIEEEKQHLLDLLKYETENL